MRWLSLISAAVMVSACAQPQIASNPATSSGPALVRLGGEGEFVEVTREAEFSIVEVRKAPAGSVPSSLYALRGACAVLRARSVQYVASERVASTVPSFRLTFPKAPKSEELSGTTKSVFSRSDCSALRF